MSQKQRTFYVGDEKITIKSRPKLWHNNPNGYAVSINGQKYHCNVSTRQEAEHHAYVRWAKECSGSTVTRHLALIENILGYRQDEKLREDDQ
jgi:hypothetical protein